MTLRYLRHGFAGATDTCDLVPGTWTDVTPQGQFLLDMEFLLKCTPSSGTASCVYCKSPSYLHSISQHFPWIHFYAYEHAFPSPEYDPAAPGITCSAPISVHIDFNRTTSASPITKDMARTLGDRAAKERESLLLICHDMDPIRQLAMQVLMRPQHALLDVAGVIPTDYLDGDIVLPMFMPQGRLFACLQVRMNARSQTYKTETYMREMAFFQRVIRSTSAYDESCRECIARQYAACTHRYHAQTEEEVKYGLLNRLDLLWAEPDPSRTAG